VDLLGGDKETAEWCLSIRWAVEVTNCFADDQGREADAPSI